MRLTMPPRVLGLVVALLLIVPFWPTMSPAGVRAASPRCLVETGRCIAGRFLAYWVASGGLARHGLPLSDEFTQLLADGKPYTVQYFERSRFELHPEMAAPDDVQLGQLGRAFHPADPPDGPRGPGTQDGYYFPETGHWVGGRFFDYWYTQGGLTQFGYPLTAAFTERLEDGNTYQVQYFERARLEYHPENPAPNDLLLGQFGRRLYAACGEAVPRCDLGGR
jgi:hypothetical protein